MIVSIRRPRWMPVPAEPVAEAGWAETVHVLAADHRSRRRLLESSRWPLAHASAWERGPDHSFCCRGAR